MRQWVADYPEQDLRWFNESNYIALLSVPSENDLIHLFKKASSLGVCCSLFREPDIDNEITAIVLEPGKKSKKLCRGLPLALKNAPNLKNAPDAEVDEAALSKIA